MGEPLKWRAQQRNRNTLDLVQPSGCEAALKH